MPGGFQLTFTGPVGQSYSVMASEKLSTPKSTWPIIGTGTFAATKTIFTDVAATNFPSRFYIIKSP